MAVTTIKKLIQRRKSKRVLSSHYIGIYDLVDEEFVGHLSNRSHNGMMIVSTRPFQPNLTYRLGMSCDIVDPPGKLYPVKAKCLWARLESQDELFYSGFQISEADHLTQKLLAAC